MKILAVLSQKGGSGKTTLAGHIAVQAELTGAGPVAVLDADPQESLAEWSNEREADTPVVVQTSLWRLKADVQRMRDEGMELLIIDTPPGITSTIRSAIDVADLVLVPAKPSPHDLRAAGRTVALIAGLGKPLVFVVNCASSRARITSDAAIALSQHGTVAPTVVHQRADFASSMIDGRSVMEIARRSPSADEIAELWEYLNDRLFTHDHHTIMTPLRGVAYA
jgi:chromosome partitioning protein